MNGALRVATLLLNEPTRTHKQPLVAAIEASRAMEWLVAYMTAGGLRELEQDLTASLKGGASVRIAVGLDEAVTEPQALRILHRLARRHPTLQVYAAAEQTKTFHFKVYAFQNQEGSEVVVGSANMTRPGLIENHEASVHLMHPGREFFDRISRHFDMLVEDKTLQELTEPLIDQYAERYEAYRLARHLSKHRARAASEESGRMAQLKEVLAIMSADRTQHGFDHQRKLRRSGRQAAVRQIELLATSKETSHATFLASYEALLDGFHSGGLHRGKTTIAKHRAEFRQAMRVALTLAKKSPSEAFEILAKRCSSIRSAGINVITEVLHAINPRKFAVMNQNSVAGIRIGHPNLFPAHPSKSSVSPNSYALFCAHAERARSSLGLADFGELDAVFNYAYHHLG
ncbi:MAG: NgoFVII family restriction endonuclease [Vitreoscilla sp.]|nr:NgoFVII family restriction endonuclease [Vitreoscilla sp.]